MYSFRLNAVKQKMQFYHVGRCLSPDYRPSFREMVLPWLTGDIRFITFL